MLRARATINKKSNTALITSFDIAITRNYQTVSVCMHLFVHVVTKVFSEVDNIANHITDMRLCHIENHSSVAACNLLSHCTHLESLALKNIDESNAAYEDEPYPDHRSIKLQNLREFTVSSSCDWMVNFIDCTKLDRLTLNHTPGYHTVEFINNLTELESMYLKQIDHLQHEIVPQFKWGFMNFDVCGSCCTCEDPDSFKNLSKLLKSSCADAHLCCDNCELYPKLFAFIVKSATNADELDITFGEIENESLCKMKREFAGVKPMKNYRKFSLAADNVDSDEIQAGWLDWLFRSLPNVAQLEVKANMLQILHPSTAPALFKKVENLWVFRHGTEADLENLQLLRFPKIDNLMLMAEVKYGQSIRRCLKKFRKKNPSLQTIKINYGSGTKTYKASKLPRLPA